MYRGLGEGTCQIPKAGNPMYYPPCPGYESLVSIADPSPGANPVPPPAATPASAPVVATPAPVSPSIMSDTGGYVAATQSRVNVGGFDVPMWGLVAAGVGALVLFGGRR